MPGLFITYEKTAPRVGRIESTATVMDEAAHAAILTAAGKLFYYVPLDGHSGYFELGEHDEVVAMCSREPFAGAFVKPQVSVLEVAELPDVPACAVRITGPSTNVMIDHQGGDLKFRLGLPGEYVVSFEAFPFQRFETSLVITPTLADPVTPEAAA